MPKRIITHRVLLPIWLLLVPDQGCLELTGWCPSGSLMRVDGCRSRLLPPVVETTVAEPQALFTQNEGRLIITVDNFPRESYELDLPAGQTLTVGLVGQARWTEKAPGRVGFYLMLQEWKSGTVTAAPNAPPGEWTTIGSAGAAGGRVGPTTAVARVRVPVVFADAGVHRLRAIVRSAGGPSEEGEASAVIGREAEDRDVVEIVVRAYPSLVMVPFAAPLTNVPTAAGDLDADPPFETDMLLP